MTPVSFAEARDTLQSLGIVLDSLPAGYRVNFKSGTEATAYRTDDLGDALKSDRLPVPLHSDFDRLNKTLPKRRMPVPRPPTDQFDSSQRSISKSQNHCAEVQAFINSRTNTHSMRSG